MRSFKPGDRERMQAHFRGENIGQPIPITCVLCYKPMTEGQIAMYESFAHAFGYAHKPCFENEQAGIAQAQKEAEAAKQGVSIAFWYSWKDPLRKAPTTGHYDQEVRQVPEGLPPFPTGAVVYEQYRRPFAMSYVDIPSREDAEDWWSKASSDER